MFSGLDIFFVVRVQRTLNLKSVKLPYVYSNLTIHDERLANSKRIYAHKNSPHKAQCASKYWVDCR